MKHFPKKIRSILKSGGIGVLPTDTIYGVVGSARMMQTVERIYRARRRNPKKPCIILIGSLRDLSIFGVRVDRLARKTLQRVWPGKISVILPCPHKKFHYLHRGTKTLAFRLPARKKLRMLLHSTGPLIAPSANPEGKKPAPTIREAKRYFGEQVDFYVSAGRRVDKAPSKVIRIEKRQIIVERK